MKFITALSLKVKIIIIVCTVAAAAAVGAVIIVNSEDAYRVIKVFELNGSAVVTRENTGDIDAYAGMNLESGDTLSVEENSTLRISLDSDKYILLDGGTVLNLIAQGTAADSRTVIELQTGTILNEIKNSLSANSSYEVNTPKATMAVRGTTFTVTTHETPDGSYITELHTAEGTVYVQLFDENGAPKGNGVYVKKDGSVTIITDVNDKTGNPAATDGNAHFVLRTNDGYADCAEENAVQYTNDTVSAEMQTERTVTSVPSETSITETSEEYSETAVTSVTTAKAVTEQYDGTDHAPVSPAAMTAAEKREDYSVTNIPERISETEYITTTVPVAAYEPVATTVPVSSADLKITSVHAVTTAPPSMPEPIRTKPIVTTVPTTVTRPAETTVPTTESEPTESETTETSAPTTEPEPTESETTETSAPTTEPEPTESETTETSAPTTEPEPTETETTETSAPTTEPEPTESETTETSAPTTEPEPTESETTETTPPSPVYKVSFADENGNILSESEFEENDTLGTLPQITDKKGYTAKWVSGGTEVTENTVISADMEITAEYTPKPVTVHICAPIDNDPLSTYGSVLTFTTLYDSSLSDNPEGYNIANLTEYVDGLYADYYEQHGRTYVLKFISINGGLDPITVTDGYIISGDYIYENSDGTLYAEVYFNYGPDDGTSG